MSFTHYRVIFWLFISNSPTSLLLGVLNALKNGRLGAEWSGRVPGWLVSHLLSFVSQFFSFVSHFFSFVPQAVACGRVPGWLVSHLLSFVSHFFSLVSQCFSFVSRAGCGRVPGWLVSHFLPFVSQFFSFVSQHGCLWSGSRLACPPIFFVCLPNLFIFVSQAGCLWSGSRLACLPLLSFVSQFFSFVFCLPGWLLVIGFLAGLSPTSFHVSPLFLICLPIPFICLPGWVLAVGFPAGLSATCFHLSPSSFHLSPRRGLVSHILSCVSHFFSFVSHFFFICLPGWVLVVGFLASLSPTCFHLSPTSFHLSPRLGACGRVGWVLVVGLAAGLFPAGLSPTYMCLPLPFICLPGCSLWSGSGLTCLPLAFMCLPILFICLAGWVLVVGLGACGRVPGWLGSHFFSFVSQFFSFVSQAGCLWSGCRLACLPLPFILLAVCRLCFDGVRVM